MNLCLRVVNPRLRGLSSKMLYFCFKMKFHFYNNNVTISLIIEITGITFEVINQFLL